VAVEENARSLALAGERRLRLASLHRTGRASVELTWANTVGAVFPASAVVGVPPPPDLVALGGGATVTLSFAGHARALEAAAECAAAHAALEAVSRELAATSRRLRAIQTRWIPEHEAALGRLELALDEAERDEIARVRWALERAGS
jgi:vacuolar-type H+-ATPase subunit D/Vma8